MIYEMVHSWRRVVRGRRVGGKKAGDKATISSDSGLRAGYSYIHTNIVMMERSLLGLLNTVLDFF